jgi:hypothetical protein
MEFRGVISSGRVVLEAGVVLPEGTKVTVQVNKAARRRTLARKSTTDPLAKLASLAVKTGRTDLADRHNDLWSGVEPRARRKAPRARA